MASEQKARSAKQASGLFDLSVRYALSGERILLVFCGISGSGKSTLADDAARRLDCEHVSTDLLRDLIVPKHLPKEERYAPAMSLKVYEALYKRASAALANDRTVIVDGTFMSSSSRKRIVEVARRQKAAAILVWARCSIEDIERHHGHRQNSGKYFGSEADLEISRRQLKTMDKPKPQEGFDAFCEVDTSQSLEQSSRAAWDGIMNALSTSLGGPPGA